MLNLLTQTASAAFVQLDRGTPVSSYYCLALSFGLGRGLSFYWFDHLPEQYRSWPN
jgi:hypothetical protein